MCLTVRISPATFGRVKYETVMDLPRPHHKAIFGFATNEAHAKSRVRRYAGDDVKFIGPDPLAI